MFGSIPEGLSAGKTSRVVLKATVGEKKDVWENAEVLSILINLGKEARSNMMGMIDHLKQTIRDNEKLNSEYNLTINKNTSSEQ